MWEVWGVWHVWSSVCARARVLCSFNVLCDTCSCSAVQDHAACSCVCVSVYVTLALVLYLLTLERQKSAIASPFEEVEVSMWISITRRTVLVSSIEVLLDVGTYNCT